MQRATFADLSTSNREVSKDTVFFVLVSSVGLETLVHMTDVVKDRERRERRKGGRGREKLAKMQL